MSRPLFSHPTGTSPAGVLRRIQRGGYRIWQFYRSLRDSYLALSEQEQATVTAYLSEPAQRLFATMSRIDQHHCIAVCLQLLATGCIDQDLLQAALLHDVGKGNGRLPFLLRPLVTLLRTRAPWLLHRLAIDRPYSWRYPFFAALHHARLGADLTAEAGLSPRIALLIRTHHQEDGPAALLHQVDEQN